MPRRDQKFAAGPYIENGRGSNTVTVLTTCPKSEVERVETYPAPSAASGAAPLLEAVQRVNTSLCDCGRPHHARFSDDDHQPSPVPLVRPGGRRPSTGVVIGAA